MGGLQVVIDALSLGSLYALIALGLGLLINILRLINFAHGDFITIAGFSLIVPSASATATMFIGGFHWLPLVVMVSAVVVLAALICDFAVFRHLRNADAGTLMAASFGMSYFIQNGIMMVYGSRPKGVNLWPELGGSIELYGLRLPVLQLVVIIVTFALMIGLSLFLKYTRWGIQTRAAASDFAMARHLGVNGNFVIGLAFAISAILAAVAGLLFVSQTGSLSFNLGVPLALFAFVASVVGGLGSLTGSVVGGYLIGGTMVLLQVYLPAGLRDFRETFTFALVLLLLMLRPQGLFPSTSVTERV